MIGIIGDYREGKGHKGLLFIIRQFPKTILDNLELSIGLVYE